VTNLLARDALERVKRVFLEKPAAARKPTAQATAIWRSRLKCEVIGPGIEKVVTDMPEAMGGGGEGPNPGWLLRASMASCTATSIAMRAALLGIELRSLEVTVESQMDARGVVGIPDVSTALDDIRMSIKIGADGVDDATLRDVAKLSEAHSTVSCTLRERPPIAIDVTVI
jgi:uncharacterized OsmC-like protein